MSKCILCGQNLNKDNVLLQCINMPASAQDIPTREELENDRGIDLQLCQCPACGLIQFDCEPVAYYRDVIRAAGYTTTMIELRRKQYRHFIQKCGLKGKKILEVGCGQGEFLLPLQEFPVEGYGIEHDPNLVKKAQNKGLRVWQAFAETEDTTIEGAPYDAFLSFNFLEHQADPNAMMKCIYRNLSEDGCGLVTVPSFEYILENDGFYELLRDHIANYTEDSLRFLMNKNGFEVLESSRLNKDTLSVIVKKRPRVDVSGLKANFVKLSEQMKEFVESRKARNLSVAIWGASHQGFTAASTAGLQNKVRYVIDSAPFKQGRYTPASHIPIVSPDYFFIEPVDCILIIAPGYTDEIAGIIRRRYGEKVEICVLRAASVEKYGDK